LYLDAPVIVGPAKVEQRAGMRIGTMVKKDWPAPGVGGGQLERSIVFQKMNYLKIGQDFAAADVAQAGQVHLVDPVCGFDLDHSADQVAVFLVDLGAAHI